MTNSAIIIHGSSRSSSETDQAIKTIIDDNNIPIIDLNTLKISAYDYEHRNRDDDYLVTMERVVQHELIILATPVYWYSVSAIMKIFIDRLSDLLEIRKDIGRKLRGKKLFVIASYGTSLPRGFEDPIEQTCEYLGIKYQGCSFIYNGNNPELKKFNEVEISKARKVINYFH